MATISPATDFAPVAARSASPARTRDPRLDFYRGIAMFIILVAHIPNNPWANWIPARFGFSDAAEIFVFCSGMASAIAFGGAFERAGWWMGTARVVFRIWQVYWAHICLFLFVAMSLAAIDLTGRYDGSYVEALNLQHFFNDPMPQLVGLFTLTYVPNYFDILPMYLVVLALMPLMMALSRIGFWAAAAASVGIWLVAQTGVLALPAEPWSDRQWFFNPFAWQLLFFTGFAFMRGWIPAPPVSRTLIWTCALFLVLSAPFGSWKVLTWVDAWNSNVAEAIFKTWPFSADMRDKTEFGLLRYMHFLSLAYLGWVVAGEKGSRLVSEGEGVGSQIWSFVLAVITKVGQQSLAVFVFSMAAAQLIGFAMDQTGRNPANVLLFNLVGFALITAVAYLAGWFKSHPWKSKK
ncbi:OpgC domain-containing protein [Ruegeria sediminis]|uniref:OpgC domain-containing protein n=1 Tax=Ruegeria sediminis TaxID=2583820 RepID=A0ABY2X3U7_9RHOB|nr:OpgC domain-containing protein [Ruegeria sediminis]TMV09639.1 OpgC domain-containing protein [Ruegeria sediminis]